MRNADSPSQWDKTLANLAQLQQIHAFAVASAVLFLILLCPAAAFVYAQSVPGSGTDLHFHKFNPPVPPEQPAPRQPHRCKEQPG